MIMNRKKHKGGMPPYQDHYTGKATTADSPNRSVWYGICSYWTDDWTKLKVAMGHIPVCPECGNIGRHVPAKEFFEDIALTEKQFPGFTEVYNKLKERCISQDEWEALLASIGTTTAEYIAFHTNEENN